MGKLKGGLPPPWGLRKEIFKDEDRLEPVVIMGIRNLGDSEPCAEEGPGTGGTDATLLELQGV
jgi:hypothetical protein